MRTWMKITAMILLTKLNSDIGTVSKLNMFSKNCCKVEKRVDDVKLG
jgi:hypothetical protein